MTACRTERASVLQRAGPGGAWHDQVRLTHRWSRSGPPRAAGRGGARTAPDTPDGKESHGAGSRPPVSETPDAGGRSWRDGASGRCLRTLSCGHASHRRHGGHGFALGHYGVGQTRRAPDEREQHEQRGPGPGRRVHALPGHGTGCYPPLSAGVAQARQGELDESVDGRFGGQAASCGEGVQAVGGELPGSVSARRSLPAAASAIRSRIRP